MKTKLICAALLALLSTSWAEPFSMETGTAATTPLTGTDRLPIYQSSGAVLRQVSLSVLETEFTNGLTITTSTGTLTIGNGKTLTASNTITLAGTDGSTLNIGTGGTLGTAAFTAATAYEVPLTFSTGLTRTTNTITTNAVNLAASGSGGVTGILPPANMGTGSSITTKYLRGDGTWQTISGGGDALTSGTLAQFAATTSAELRGVLSDETGTGIAYFVGGALGTPASVNLSNATDFPATVTLDTDWDTAAKINAATTDDDFLTTTAAASAYQPKDAVLDSLSLLTDPGSDHLLFWDDSVGNYAHMTIGSNLTVVAGTALATSSAVLTNTSTHTLTNKSISGEQINSGTISDNRLSATATIDTDWDTAAKINAATTDDDFVTLTGTENLSNKTIASPVFSGTFTGTFTIGGTSTWNGGIIGPTYLGTGSSITTKYLRGDGTWQTLATGTGDLLAANNLSDVANAASARSNLGLEIDVDVLGFDTDLDAIAALSTQPEGRSFLTVSPSTGNMYFWNGSAWDHTTTTTEGRGLLTVIPSSGSIYYWNGLAWSSVTSTTSGRALLTASALTATGLGLTNGATIDTWGGKTAPSGTVVGTTDAQTLTGKKITLSGALGTDDTYEGSDITGLNAGATIAQWEAVYLGGSSTWLLADANGSGTFPARGVAVAAYSDTNAATVLTRGTVRNDAWAWTPGGTIYLSGTAGGLTQTAPATSGDKVQQVGFALTADVAFFDFASGETVTVE